MSDVDECPEKLKSLGVIEPPPRKTVIRIDVDEDDELEDSDDTAIDTKVFAILECLIPYFLLNVVFINKFNQRNMNYIFLLRITSNTQVAVLKH